MDKWNTQCKFFNEKYACDTLVGENYESCNECKFCTPYSKKILILKFGAMGDVLRTTPILEALRKKYGEDILIYWMTSENSFEVLEGNPLIDKIIIYNIENILRIQQEKFDILFSLEIDTPATLLANLVNANEKYGFYFNNDSTSCFNKNAEPYLETAFLQHKKLQNRKTYQELIFDVCGLSYNKEKPFFNLKENDYLFSENFKSKNNLSASDKIIGINIGSASRWASKFWSNEQIINLIKKIHLEFKIIILAGPNEIDKQNDLIERLKLEKINVLCNNPNNSIREFASIVNLCDSIICGDTLILHLATALNKKVIALFFSTPEWEVEDYGSVKKIQSPLLEKYFFINEYHSELADSISIENVLGVLNKNK